MREIKNSEIHNMYSIEHFTNYFIKLIKIEDFLK